MSTDIRLDGVVGRDPEIKFLDSGLQVANFPLAVDEMKKKDGQWVKESTQWFRVAVWGDHGEAVTEQVKKGDRVIVQGALKISSYEKDGETKPTADVTARLVAVVPRKAAKPKTQQTDEPW